MDDDKHDRIRERAYKLWEDEGRPDGEHERHWHAAQAELDREAALPLTADDALPGAREIASTDVLAVEELAELTEGFLAGVVIHAVDALGNHEVVNFRCQGEIRYWLWEDSMSAPELRAARTV